MSYKRASVPLLVCTVILLVSLASPSFQLETNEDPPSIVKIDNSRTLGEGEDEEEEEGLQARSFTSAKEIYTLAHGHEEKDSEGNTHYLILEQGDAFSVLATDDNTGCMHLSEDNIPPHLNGDQRFGEHCEPNEFVKLSEKCRLYTYVPVSAEKPGKKCLKPTHLHCDPDIRKCVCGNEGIIIPPIRFQFGNYAGKNYSDGMCFIRPTFDFIPGFECAPGTERKKIVVEEDAEPTLICGCKLESDIDKFDSSDMSWWRCGGGSNLAHSHFLLLLTLVVNIIKLLF